MLQSMYLKTDTLCYNLLNKEESFGIKDPEIFYNLSIKLNGHPPKEDPIRPDRNSLSPWEVSGLISEAISILIFKKHNKLIRNLWECWSDLELLDLIKFDFEFKKLHYSMFIVVRK